MGPGQEPGMVRIDGKTEGRRGIGGLVFFWTEKRGTFVRTLRAASQSLMQNDILLQPPRPSPRNADADVPGCSCGQPPPPGFIGTVTTALTMSIDIQRKLQASVSLAVYSFYCRREALCPSGPLESFWALNSDVAQWL